MLRAVSLFYPIYLCTAPTPQLEVVPNALEGTFGTDFLGWNDGVNANQNGTRITTQSNHNEGGGSGGNGHEGNAIGEAGNGGTVWTLAYWILRLLLIARL